MTPQTEIEILKLEKAILELDAEWNNKEAVFYIYTSRGSVLPIERAL